MTNLEESSKKAVNFTQMQRNLTQENTKGKKQKNREESKTTKQ